MQCCGCGSGSGSAWIRNFCLDPDPELKFQIRIQQKVKEHINKIVNSGLVVVLDNRIECNILAAIDELKLQTGDFLYMDLLSNASFMGTDEDGLQVPPV